MKKKQRWVDSKNPKPLTGIMNSGSVDITKQDGRTLISPSKQGTVISFCPYCERITPFTNHHCNICGKKASVLRPT